jgi:hypothetical protein
VFNDGCDLREQYDAETQLATLTAAFKLDFVFVTEKSWFDSFNETGDIIFQRRLKKPGPGPNKEQKRGNPNAFNDGGRKG